MKKRDLSQSDTHQRDKLIGLGNRSMSKSYYPELQTRLQELERFRCFLENINEIILIVDISTGIISDAVGAAKHMTGLSPNELVGTELSRILPEHVAKHIDALFTGKRTYSTLEANFHNPNQPDVASIPVEMNIQPPLEEANGQAVIIARNISERKQAEEEIRRYNEELELRVKQRTTELRQANKAQTEFMNIMSHEMRTPLTSILGFARIIQKKLAASILPALPDKPPQKITRDSTKVMGNLNVIISEGERLTLLVNDMLDLAKHEARKIRYSMEPLDMNELVDRALSASAGFFEQNGPKLIRRKREKIPPVVGDPNRLIQVFINLLANAVKFCPRGKVSVTAHHAGAWAVFSVEDTGIGIPEDMREAVFDKFTQAEASAETRHKGTGLGLPICRHIIKDHGGSIWVEDREDGQQGTVIKFTLPVLESRDAKTS